MQQTHTSTTPSEPTRTNRLKLTWGLICLIGPTALIIVSFFIYAIINFVVSQNQPADSSYFYEPSPVRSIGNIILFAAGAISVITFLPGIIIGIILLATRKKSPTLTS